MLTVQPVEPGPGNGSAPSLAHFDLVRFEAAIEASVCRALREEITAQKEVVTDMGTVAIQTAKPAERSPQQTSEAKERACVTPNGTATRDICQEAFNKILVAAEQKARAEYDAAHEAADLLATEIDLAQAKNISVQGAIDVAASEAQQGAEAERSAMDDTRARAREALAPYVATGVVSSDEVELHLESVLREASERLLAARQDAILRLDSLNQEMKELRLKKADLDSRQAALCERLAQLRTLPSIVALEKARREEETRKADKTRQAIRFLETAPWHQLSWQKRLTPEMEKAVALTSEDRMIFDTVVMRLGRELDQVDAARPGLGWSVVRAIEALEIGRLFPSLETRRAELVQAARRHNYGQGHPAMADKVISLASRWGARVADR